MWINALCIWHLLFCIQWCIDWIIYVSLWPSWKIKQKVKQICYIFKVHESWAKTLWIKPNTCNLIKGMFGTMPSLIDEKCTPHSQSVSNLVQVLPATSILFTLVVLKPEWSGQSRWIPPDSKVHGANMGTTWGRQDPGGPHVGPMNLAIWGQILYSYVVRSSAVMVLKL